MQAESEDRDVSWEALGPLVRGTITRPRNGTGRAGVVFVAGSGPTDRNWCSPALPGQNGSGSLLARRFAQEGFVTLRYDKLGSGPQGRENATKLGGEVSMQSHVEELAGGVRTLNAEPGVRADRIFALTNSEGAIHAINYQLRSPDLRFHGFVLTGAPGIAIGSTARRQLAEQGKGLPNLAHLLQLYDEAIARFLLGQPANPDASLPEGVRQLIRGLENPLNQPFARELWTYSLAEHIARIAEPILVLIGKKDVQIDWKVDGSALAAATVGKENITLAYPESANHVLKHEERPREELSGATVGLGYNAPGAQLDAEAVHVVTEWLAQQLTPQ